MKKLVVICLALTILSTLSVKALEIESPAFKNGEKIPEVYTCDGKDISPKLIFRQIPARAKTLVLIMDDPDAPMGTWVHWVVYNIPVSVKELQKDFPKKALLSNGTIQGKNSWGKIGYGGPCPPKPTGEHRYFFKLYAIDTVLNLPQGATKQEVLKAIKEHIVAQAVLMGRYSRK